MWHFIAISHELFPHDNAIYLFCFVELLSALSSQKTSEKSIKGEDVICSRHLSVLFSISLHIISYYIIIVCLLYLEIYIFGIWKNVIDLGQLPVINVVEEMWWNTVLEWNFIKLSSSIFFFCSRSYCYYEKNFMP